MSKPPEDSPEVKAAINGVTKWAALKGWKSEPRFVRSLTGALRKFCADADAITACIEHFYDNSKFIPSPSEIKEAARYKAWDVQGQERLRRLKQRASLSCGFCFGEGHILKKIKRPIPVLREGATEGQMEEIDAVGWCSCDYGRARAQASAAQARKAERPPQQDSKLASASEIIS